MDASIGSKINVQTNFVSVILCTILEHAVTEMRFK